MQFRLPAFIHIPLCYFSSSDCWWIMGHLFLVYLKAKFKVNEVIVTIMMNYIALICTYDLIKRFIHEGNEKTYDIKRVHH